MKIVNAKNVQAYKQVMDN